jgi:hypothetical protein
LICHRFYSNLDTPWCRRLLAYYWRRSSFAKQAKMAIHAGAEAPNDEAMAKFVMTLSSFGNIRTTVMRARDETEYLPLIQELP